MSRWTQRCETWLARRLPPGIPAKREWSKLLLGTALSAGWAILAYLCAYAMALDRLYTVMGGERVLISGARMADFGQVFRFAPAGYVVFAGWLVFRGGWFVASHRQGSMSVYLMRRLPDRWEYARRCWTAPLLGLGTCLALTVITAALCYLIYTTCTPASCLVPGQWTRFWSALIGR